MFNRYYEILVFRIRVGMIVVSKIFCFGFDSFVRGFTLISYFINEGESVR